MNNDAPLLEETLRLAATTRLSKAEIVQRAEVSLRWWYMVLDGRIRDPGVRRISRVHRVLIEDAANKSRSKKERFISAPREVLSA
jgi:hypothetical protein